MTRHLPSREPESRREQLATQALGVLMGPGGDEISFRGLASALGVSRPTLRHHFGDEHGLIRSALEVAEGFGHHWNSLVEQAEGSPEERLLELVWLYVEGWKRGALARLHRLGMRLGLADADMGKMYAERFLGRGIDAYATLLGRWHADGALHAPNPAAAALALLGPVHLLLVVRHNLLSSEGLGGLDEREFVEQHVAQFIEVRSPR